MIVLGIDCGLATTGWGVLNSRGGNRSPLMVEYGTIKTEAGNRVEDRIGKIYDETTSIIKKHKPHCVAIESLFYFKNQKTVMSVGQARGVVILAASKNHLETYDYTPLQVKQAVTGYGKATKEQIQKMIKVILNLKEIPKPDDAADALAVSYCHISSNPKLAKVDS